MSPKNEAATASGIRLALLNGSYQSAANIYYLVVRSIYIIVFARILGVELYGYYVYAQSWYLLAMAISVWGMNELASAEYVRLERNRKEAFVSGGFALRLLLSVVCSLGITVGALLAETDSALRLLIIIYAQAVVVRGAINWFMALFIAREKSRYWVQLSIPFLTLEVVLATILAVRGSGLVDIAVAQCAVWWLQLLVTWVFYARKFGPITPRFDREYTHFFITKGASLALAAFILGFLGSGLLIVFRQFNSSGQELGEAAFVIQIVVVLCQMIKTVSNAALPQLSRLGVNRQQRQAFYTAVVWRQSMYAGGALFLLSYVLLPPVVIALVGDQFWGAARLFARFSWLLIPVFLVYGLRLVLISNGQARGFLFAMALGLLALALQVGWFAWADALGVSNLIQALGVGYTVIAAVILGMIQQRFRLLSISDLVLAPGLLLICLGVFFVGWNWSPVLATVSAIIPLFVASALEFRLLYAKATAA